MATLKPKKVAPLAEFKPTAHATVITVAAELIL